MKLIQYTGPFTAGQRIEVPAQIDQKYVHIGIQVPHNPHITQITDEPLSPIIEIREGRTGISTYFVNWHDILEFDNTADVSLTIRFLTNLPAEAIIDVAYSIEDK